jgi:hypothetical protein
LHNFKSFKVSLFLLRFLSTHKTEELNFLSLAFFLITKNNSIITLGKPNLLPVSTEITQKAKPHFLQSCACTHQEIKIHQLSAVHKQISQHPWSN